MADLNRVNKPENDDPSIVEPIELPAMPRQSWQLFRTRETGKNRLCNESVILPLAIANAPNLHPVGYVARHCPPVWSTIPKGEDFRMKWEYIGAGLALIGIGVTLVLALPPPWWPKMSSQLIHVGVLSGVVLVLVGVCILVIGVVPGLPAGKIGPIFLTVLGVLFFVAGIIWYLIPMQDTQATVARLAGLGWTVKPGQDDILFEIAGGSLPPMQESSTHFAQLNRPFRLHFQSVQGLEGLHYLADVTDCKNIEINAGEFTDISELRGFSHLTKLIISQVPLNGIGTVDSSPLSSLINLQELNLGMTRVRTLDFLASLKTLKILYLGQTLITDISPIAGLASLEYLDIRGTRVTDLLPLKQNENLTVLSVGGEQIKSIINLANLKKLKKLTIIEQGNTDLSPISTLANLEYLWIWGLPEFDLSPLRSLTKLNEVQLSGLGFSVVSPVTDIQAISVLSGLKKLTLGSLQLNELAFAVNLTNLEEINLNVLPITSITPLSGLRSLKKISLVQTAVVDVSPLLELPALTELNVIRTPARADILAELERRGVKVTR